MTHAPGENDGSPCRESSTKLVTVQPVAVWECLRREKCLLVDPFQPGFAEGHYLIAYDWLREQMQQRLCGYKGHYPWWAWVGREPKCLMKGAWVYGSGETLVRLELSIAPERLLVSEFSAWHHPLNDTYLPLTTADSVAWETECQARKEQDFGGSAELPSDLQARVRLSWERCLDSIVMEQSEFFTQGLYQATFEELRLDDVTKMTRFRRRLMAEPASAKAPLRP